MDQHANICCGIGVTPLKLARRRFLHLVMGTLALPSMCHVAFAQTFPVRPVHLIVGFPPGQAADIIARLIGHGLSERLGQQFVVDNRPGAGSNIASETVVRSPADGYTLLLITATNAINAALYQNLNFNFIRDIAPIATIGRSPFVMVINPSFPAKTVPEFIAYAKTNPGKISMGSAGIGSPSHVFGELFQMMSGTNMVHVPYRGAFIPDLLSGQVQVEFGSIPSSLQYIRTGKLRALAVTTATRSDILPDIPTLGEFVTDYEATAWFGIGAPKNISAEILDKLNKDINSLVADPNIKARLFALGVEPMPMTFTECGKFITDETEKWAKVIKFANIQPI